MGAPRATGLKAHPNWKGCPKPHDDETLIAYTLRCAATLLSPPKIAGEDNEIPCQDAAFEIRQLEAQIDSRWRQFHSKRKPK